MSFRSGRSVDALRQRGYEALNAIPGLPPEYRNVFAGMLMEPGAHLLVHVPAGDVPEGRAHAFPVCRGGVFAVVFGRTR